MFSSALGSVSHTSLAATTVNVEHSIAAVSLPLADHVKLLWIALHSRLSMDEHVNQVNRRAYVFIARLYTMYSYKLLSS